MQQIRSLENFYLKTSCATIGSFDGVHLGHQMIIRHLADKSRSIGAPSVVLTFSPHPAVLLQNIENQFYLTTEEEKADILEKMGMNFLIILTFNQLLASQSAHDFMEYISSHLGLHQLVIGDNFTLGRNRQGNFQLLKQLGEKLGYSIKTATTVTIFEEKISSSYIRQLLKQGSVARAAKLLGRWYSINGRVIHGDRRGYKLGIPTANLDFPHDKVLPSIGVYAAKAYIANNYIPAVVNIGLRPTFYDNQLIPHLEAHLLDFNQDLYGSTIKLEFIQYLRPERKFSSVQALLEQIHKDIKEANRVLSNAT